MSELHDAINHYHGLLNNGNAETIFRQLEALIRERGMLVGKARDRLICSVLRPRFVTEAQYTMVQHAAKLVGRAIRKVGAAALEEPTLIRPYALTMPERVLLTIDPGYAGVSAFGRLDGFLADDGSQCFFIESNLESPAGIAYDEALATMFEQLEVMQTFRQTYYAEALPVRQGLQQLLLDTYREWGGTNTPTIAIVDFRNASTYSEFVYLREQFTAAGIPTVIVDPADLKFDGQRLYADAFDAAPDFHLPAPVQIDLVYRRVLQHEFLAQYDLDHPLVQAYARRAVCVVNPFTTKPVHTKLIMALLSDEDGPVANLVDADERAAVAQHIPWTRHVREGQTRYAGERVDLLRFASQHKDQLVLKPNDEYGGAGVVLGWETEQAAWDVALQSALASPYIVQERVPVPQEDYPTWTPDEGLRFTPRYVDSDPCVYGDTAMGCLTRIASTSLLNVTAGGGSAPPTFVVKKQ